MIRPRRSVLFMPGSNARALEKAKTLAADGFIFDLEDAVAPDAKQAAELANLEGEITRCRKAYDAPRPELTVRWEQNVREAYNWLVQTFNEAPPGGVPDEIYIFGFSRGAGSCQALLPGTGRLRSRQTAISPSGQSAT